MTDKYQFEVSPDGKPGRRRRKGNSPTSAPIPSSNPSTSRTSRNPYATSASPARTRWTATVLPLRKSTSSARPQANKIHSLSCMKAFRLFRPERLSHDTACLQTMFRRGKKSHSFPAGKPEWRTGPEFNSACAASAGRRCRTCPAWRKTVPERPPPSETPANAASWDREKTSAPYFQ